MMDFTAFTQRVKEIVEQGAGLKGTVKFEMPEGTVAIDATQNPNTVSNGNPETDCTIKISLENAVKIMNGETNAMTAFMLGKIKVYGDMAIAMKVVQVISK